MVASDPMYTAMILNNLEESLTLGSPALPKTWTHADYQRDFYLQ